MGKLVTRVPYTKAQMDARNADKALKDLETVQTLQVHADDAQYKSDIAVSASKQLIHDFVSRGVEYDLPLLRDYLKHSGVVIAESALVSVRFPNVTIYETRIVEGTEILHVAVQDGVGAEVRLYLPAGSTHPEQIPRTNELTVLARRLRKSGLSVYMNGNVLERLALQGVTAFIFQDDEQRGGAILKEDN